VGATSIAPQGGLAEVLDLVLDKGLVIDVFAKVSVVGIEILTIDARITVASVGTCLRFAEATNRLDLHAKEGKVSPSSSAAGRALALKG
jgi:gas vesicle structural protein